jgi:hypothetical protein
VLLKLFDGEKSPGNGVDITIDDGRELETLKSVGNALEMLIGTGRDTSKL